MWLQVLIVIVGAILGSLVGRITADIRFLSWLSFGDIFGLTPTTLDLGVFKLTVGFQLEVTIAAIIGLILAVLFARRLR